MKYLPQKIEELIEEFSLLPGIGPKSAARLALFLQKAPVGLSKNLADKIVSAKDSVKRCSLCFGLSTEDYCPICSDEKRQNNVLMVVEDSLDLVAIEEAGVYNGRYHVLGGLISPMKGIGVNELMISEFTSRIKKENIREIVFALNTDMDGEATILYISNLLEKIEYDGKLTRLARGIAKGVDLDYLDRSTLGSAFLARIEV